MQDYQARVQPISGGGRQGQEYSPAMADETSTVLLDALEARLRFHKLLAALVRKHGAAYVIALLEHIQLELADGSGL